MAMMAMAAGRIVCLVLVLMDIVAGILGIEAQIAQNRQSYVKVLVFECREPSYDAYRLGLAATVLLALAHAFANALGGCVCISSREELQVSSPNRQRAAGLLVFLWITLIVAFLLLVIGTASNSRSRENCGFAHQHVLVFGGILCFVHGMILAAYYVSANAAYAEQNMVPFEHAVTKVSEQLKSIARGNYSAPSAEKRKLGSIVFAAVNLPVDEILGAFNIVSEKNPEVEAFLKDKDLGGTLRRAHLTLAHKRSHGVAAVANYAEFLNQKVPVSLTALLFSDKMAAIEACSGSVDGQKVESKNQWPHITVWTGEGVAPKEANNLPHLHSQGDATRVEIDPPIVIHGTVEFF